MTRSGPVGVGFIGTGMISNTYLENLTRFPDIDVIILGDLNVELARSRAEQHEIRQWGTADDVLNHPDVEVVVNLTIPAVHAEVAGKAIAAGKNVWTEKPISVDLESGRALLAQAEAAGLLVGVAPDTVLGPGMQTARRAIARGDIGEPLSAQTVMQYVGPDIFHPNPEFLFSPGAGPLFDIGPYYLTALVQLFGSVQSVAAVGSRSRGTRTIRAGERAGTTFDVLVPTHVSAVAQFVDGGVSQSVFSFDSPLTRMGYVEVTGTEGTMIIPDPNLFTGDVLITRAPAFAALAEDPQWESVAITGVYAERGLGVLDLARASRTGGTPLASGELGFHVLDTMVAIEEAITENRTVAVESRVGRVPWVAEDFDPFAATV
ncbi:MAG TPA: Gfo/Idh/MocA family oxidoreductase [Microlunatus sp.]